MIRPTITVSFLLLMFLCTTSAQPTPAISRVQAAVDSMDKAFASKDALAVIGNYSTNALITAVIIENGRTNTTSHGRDAYQHTLEAGFTNFDDYTLQRKDVSIDIAPDGQSAQCLSTITETFRFSGKTEEAVSKESLSFDLMGSKALVTKDHSDITIK